MIEGNSHFLLPLSPLFQTEVSVALMKKVMRQLSWCTGGPHNNSLLLIVVNQLLGMSGCLILNGEL